jgi:hypothetical protein
MALLQVRGIINGHLCASQAMFDPRETRQGTKLEANPALVAARIFLAIIITPMPLK